MTPETHSTQHIADLLRQLRDDTTTLVREEVALAKTETAEKIPGLMRNAGLMAAGGLMAFSALLLVLLALGWALRELFISQGMSEGVSMFLGLIIIAAIVGGISASLIIKAKNALKGESLAPRKTVQTLQEDKQWVQRKVTT